ncbi:MAG: rhodanese-like domain-containing protein [Anaerolineales bacterium]|nr:rhodanese-like domain-containing protein [Anaerolineales bacterium]
MSKKNKKPVKSKNNSTLIWAGVGIAILVLVGIFLLQQNNAATTNKLPREISVSEASAKRDAGAFILDVREPDEWNESHIPGATLIPLGELASRVDELPKDQEIVVVCRSGNRSQQGRDALLSAGFSQVTSMAGGIKQWTAAGLETVSGP